MQTTNPDAFALENSNVDAFLYAKVGAELNGSALTVLSMMARLGLDPWVEAARWAELPRVGVVESLVESIAQMPLVPSALAETRATAARLVQLLPPSTRSSRQGDAVKAEALPGPKWLRVSIYCALAFGLAVNVVLMIKQLPQVTAPLDQPTRKSEVTGSAAVSLRPGVADARSLEGLGRQ
jgi:hypothetical protein